MSSPIILVATGAVVVLTPVVAVTAVLLSAIAGGHAITKSGTGSGPAIAGTGALARNL